MIPISIEEARDLFLSHPARLVSQEQSVLFYDNFSGDIEIVPYLTCGCMIVKTDDSWFIHALAEDSDILSAILEVVECMDKNNEKVFVFTLEQIPEQISDNAGSYKFAREYSNYFDDEIRPLTTADIRAIESCCFPDPLDTDIGKAMASSFLELYPDFLINPECYLIGLFHNNVLVGVASAEKHEALGIAVIDIYVNREHRKKGYAKRLISAICSVSKDCTYCYSCLKTNEASANTAKACGFEFKGAYLGIIF